MKNTMMRIASILMVVALLTACVISGTFAKYITTTEGSDNARVARWGIVIEAAEDSMFLKEYETEDDTYDGDLSVQAETEVVAPGTTNEENPLVLATISGTPEVATRITLSFDTFEVPHLDDYYPVNFVLTVGDEEIPFTDPADLEDISVDFAPGELTEDFEITLTWSWTFYVDVDTDILDTQLGNEEELQEINLAYTITAVQID